MKHRDVVAVGTSAGGVDALNFLARSFPPDFPASVLVTLHLPRTSRSELDAILNRAGPLRAAFAVSGMRLERSRIYIAPADHHLLLDGDCIFLGSGPRENNVRPAIDPMFRSIALCCGVRAIGVVLTGNLGDGASGLWTLKLSGGLTVVQDPKDAAFSEMPFNAMDQVAPHHVAPLRDMPALLGDLVRQPWGKSVAPRASLAAEVAIAKGSVESMDTMDKIGRRSVLACPECHGVLWEIDESGHVHYRCHTGHAFGTEALGALIDDSLRRALASALRAMEERLALMRRLEQQAKSHGHRLLSENWAARAREVEEELNVLRSAIAKIENLAVAPAAE